MNSKPFSRFRKKWLRDAKQNYARMYKIRIFDAKLRFALLATLRSAIFGEINCGQLISHFPGNS